METMSKTSVRISELGEVIERLTETPPPKHILERRRALLRAAERVRESMLPMPGDIKDLIRQERRDEALG
jgi:hypothetical protein